MSGSGALGMGSYQNVAHDQPSEVFYRRMGRQLAPRGRLRSRLGRPLPALAAAGLVAVAALAFWAGLGSRSPQAPPEDSPPPVDRVIRFERGIDWHGP